MSKLREIEYLRKKIEKNIDILSKKIKIIDELKKDNRPPTIEEKNQINSQFPTNTADPEILALMLEAKVEGRSRTERRKVNPNDRYEPFVISNNDAFDKLFEIINEKQGRREPFKFDFINIRDGHATPVQITSDGSKPYFFNVDAYGIDISKRFGDFNVHSYSSGEIQMGNKECGVFAIQNLNTLNNMSLEEKRKISDDIDNLDPRFFKMTQSLSKLPEKNYEKVISKRNKPVKTLGDHLDKTFINVVDRKTREMKQQNRFFDEKYYKYLLKVAELIKDKSDADVLSIINKRSRVSEEWNTDQHIRLNQDTFREYKSIINESSDPSKILEVVNFFSYDDRHRFLNEVKDAFSRFETADNVAQLINSFSEVNRNSFVSLTKNLLSRISKFDGLDKLIEYDASLTADIQKPLSKGMQKGIKPPLNVFCSIIKHSPKTQRWHFVENIKLYINDISNVNEKACNLLCFAKYLPEVNRQSLNEEVEGLLSNRLLDVGVRGNIRKSFSSLSVPVQPLKKRKAYDVFLGANVENAEEITPPNKFNRVKSPRTMEKML